MDVQPCGGGGDVPEVERQSAPSARGRRAGGTPASRRPGATGLRSGRPARRRPGARRPGRPTTPGRAARPRVRRSASLALVERPRRARPGGAALRWSPLRGRSPATWARNPPVSGQPPRRPPASTCTLESGRSRSTLISSVAAAGSGPCSSTWRSWLRRRATSRRDTSARASTSRARAAHSAIAGSSSALTRSSGSSTHSSPISSPSVRSGMHQRAHMSSSGRPGIRTGPTAFARSNVFTTRATGGSTRRSRMVRNRVLSTGPRVAHQTGRCRRSSTSTDRSSGPPADRPPPERPRAGRPLARLIDPRRRFPSQNCLKVSISTGCS